MEMDLHVLLCEVPEGYVGVVAEIPGANVFGTTLAEAERQVEEAIQRIFEANRRLAEDGARGRAVIWQSRRISITRKRWLRWPRNT